MRKIIFWLLLLSSQITFAQSRKISGTIIDKSDSSPIPGVTVNVPETTIATSSDMNGNYSIEVPEGKNSLIFRFIGYQPRTVVINENGINNISLEPDRTLLKEVVAVGYGTQRKIELTGSIASVKGEELTKQVSQNPMSSLQGKVAGVQITNNGQPGSSPTVRIRGTGSIYGRTEPLYVVDGIVLEDISFLNQNDIETISLLKDASSASIYGVRAANGLVLITTKKGKAGKTKVDYTGFAGIQRVQNVVKMASAKQYGFLINEKFGIPTVSEYPTTNWQEEILRKSAMIHNHQIGISGGSEKNNFHLSFGYLNQDGIIENNNFEKINARLQNDIKLNDNIKVGYNAMFYHFNSVDVPNSVLLDAFRIPSIIPVRKENGNYGDSFDFNLGDFPNPQATLDRFNQLSKGQSITGSVYGDVKILKDFTFRSALGLTYGTAGFRNYAAKDSLTTVQKTIISRLTKETGTSSDVLWENTLTYTKAIGENRFTFLAGTSAQKIKNEKFIGTISDVPFKNEGSLNFNLGDPTTAIINNPTAISTILSYYGRLNYSFKERYLLTAALRRDGSSKFPKDSRFDNFPSVGLGWILSEENFMKSIRAINSLKLKASWGRLGNAGIPANITVLRATTGGVFNTTPFGIGSNLNRIVPPFLFWEVVEEYDFGFEAEMMNSKVVLEADYYIKDTKDAIFAVPILSSLGIADNAILGNYASFRNSGVELSATYRSTYRGVRYSVNANGAFNKNNVTAVKTGNSSIFSGGLPVGGILTNVTRIGDPIGSFYGYIVEGIFQTNEEAENSGQSGAKAGWFNYKDINNDGLIDANDKQILGNPNPRFIYGISLAGDYRRFDFQLDIQGVAGVEIYNAMKGVRYGNENYTLDFYENRWNGAGTSNTYPSAELNGPNLEASTFFVEKGDYVRIRNVQVGYTLSSERMSALKIEKLRIFVGAQNPLTIFGYKGFTPEVGGSPTSAGIDLNVYPISSTFNAGVNLVF